MKQGAVLRWSFPCASGDNQLRQLNGYMRLARAEPDLSTASNKLRMPADGVPLAPVHLFGYIFGEYELFSFQVGQDRFGT